MPNILAGSWLGGKKSSLPPAKSRGVRREAGKGSQHTPFRGSAARGAPGGAGMIRLTTADGSEIGRLPNDVVKWLAPLLQPLPGDDGPRVVVKSWLRRNGLPTAVTVGTNLPLRLRIFVCRNAFSSPIGRSQNAAGPCSKGPKHAIVGGVGPRGTGGLPRGGNVEGGGLALGGASC